MSELFKTKVRSVGTSLGILIPSEIIKNQDIEAGTEIEVTILKKNNRLIKETFGSVKIEKHRFARDKKDKSYTY